MERSSFEEKACEVQNFLPPSETGGKKKKAGERREGEANNENWGNVCERVAKMGARVGQGDSVRGPQESTFF